MSHRSCYINMKSATLFSDIKGKKEGEGAGREREQKEKVKMKGREEGKEERWREGKKETGK